MAELANAGPDELPEHLRKRLATLISLAPKGRSFLSDGTLLSGEHGLEMNPRFAALRNELLAEARLEQQATKATENDVDPAQ